MQLVGDVVESYGLTGREAIPALIGKFTQERAKIAGNMLPGMDKAMMSSLRDKQRQLKRVAGGILGDVPLQSEVVERERALRHVVADYLCSEFGMRYDLISDELFKIKRNIPYTVTLGNDQERKIEITIPLFFSVPFGSSELHKIESTRKIDYDDCKVSLSCSPPPLTQEAKKKAREAKAYFLEIYARALREEGIGQRLMQDFEGFSRAGNFDMTLKWIPRPSDLEITAQVIEKDPLVIAQVYGKNYLVARWDVEGEEPYQHYLAEFMEKKAG